ncbi:stereocilin isoform X4 [Haliaeetus albicilla]|uniref:stereocilin isoform X4 n=1 Tax=Haliaeetus albicilla TaxID=8969 RepID=UPI0037E7795D
MLAGPLRPGWLAGAVPCGVPASRTFPAGAASGGSGAAARRLAPVLQPRAAPRPSGAVPPVPRAGARRRGGTPAPGQSPPEAAGAPPASGATSTPRGGGGGADELSGLPPGPGLATEPRGPVRLLLPPRSRRRRAALLSLPCGLWGRPGGGPPSAPRSRRQLPPGRAGPEERNAGPGPCGPLRSSAPGLRDTLLRAAARALGAPRTDSDGRCAGTLPQLLLWGFHHNLSWDARGLGFAAGVLPAPPPLPGCLQPVPRAAASAPQGQPSLLPPVLEAVCNDSVPGLPGVSNFTVYLYCNLFNSSRGSSQRLGDLGAACSNAAWYLSAGEGGSAWARACREHYPAQFNSTVCSNTSLRETPGPQQVLLEQLCADLAQGLAGARPPSRSACPLGARWEDAWSCFLGSRVLWGARLCGSGSRELLPTDLRAWLSQLCGGPQPQAQMPNASEPGGTDPCSFRAQSLWARGNTGLLELCRTVPPSCFQELVCTNASLLQLLGHPQPVVGVHCQGALPGGHCLLKQLLALLPLHPRLDATELCPDPAAYLLGLASQLPQCEEEAPGWAPHVNYLLRLLDRSLALSRREEAGQAAGEQLSDAILLSSLLDNTSFWGLLRVNASRVILRAVGQYLGWEHRASAKRELLSCFSAVLWDLLQDSEGAPALDILAQEYLQMPEESFQGLLLTAGPEAVQRFLALLHRSWHRLRGEVPSPTSGEEALPLLAVLLLRGLPHLTPQLFVSLSQFIPFLAVSDIARLPPALLANESVLAALRTHSARLTQGQKAAFARRLLQAPFLGAVPTWPLGFLRAILPLLPHLPLHCFLQLTPQQIWGLGDGWQLLRLGLVQGRHVAGSLANRSHAAGPEPGHRLGTLACFLSPEDLQDLAWLRDPRGAVEQSLLACAAAGTLQQHGRVMLALADLLRSTSLAMVSPGELPAWRGVLPEMGVGFLQHLSAAQLNALLPQLRPMHLTRAQVSPAWLQTPWAGGSPSPGHSQRVQHSAARQPPSLAPCPCQGYAVTADHHCLVLPPGILPACMGCPEGQCDSRGSSQAVSPPARPGTHVAGSRPGPTPGPRLRMPGASPTPALSGADGIPAAGSAAPRRLAPLPPAPAAPPAPASWCPGFSGGSVGPEPALVPAAGQRLGTGLWGKVLPPCASHSCPPQQAQLLWREVGASTNRSHHTAGALGSLVVGMSCMALQELGQQDFLGALRTLYVQPRSLPASLVRRRLHNPCGSQAACPCPALKAWCPQRRCVQEEVLRRPALSEEEMAWLGPRFLMELPAKLVEMLPDAMMRLVLDHAIRQPRSLLALPATRRAALARGALHSLRLPAGTELGGEDLDWLGPLVGFLGRETVARVQPQSLLPRLGDLQDTCLAAEAGAELGRLLLSEQALGTPPSWRLPTLQQLGRLVFLLPLKSLRAIPRDLLSRDTVEQLLQSQRDWEQSELGRLCHPPGTLGEGPSPQEVLVAPLVAAAGPGEQGETVHSPPQPCPRSCTSCPWCPPMPCPHTLCPCCPCSPCCSLPGLALCPQCPHADSSLAGVSPSCWGQPAQASSAAPVPSCADMRATFPAVWSAAQLAAMAPQQLEGCLGLLSQDTALRPDQLRAVLGQAQRLWGSTGTLEPAQTLRLGRLATQLGEPELRELLLPDWGALSALGELDSWSPEQMRAVVSAFLRQRGVSAQDLGLPELVALGHLICGLSAAELRGLDSQELSKAAPFLGSLSLRCTEQQVEVLAAHLTSSAAFGPAATWGPEIFAEVGTLAAGLPDIVLSALVPEQIWALTPRAIAAVPAPKFAVVFGPAQLRTLSSTQAAAVTLGQRQWLSSTQRQALASAQHEGQAAQDSQGRSGDRPQSGFSLVLLLCLTRCFL